MLLILFAFIAGVGTALSPCVLPVLPIALSAGATGGKRRPLGIVTGLALSFTFVTVALVYVIAALGLPNDLLRTIAIVGLIGFGVALAIPRVGDRVEAWISRMVRINPKNREGGFGSGVLVGISLGFVYAPCAGPILAGVLTVSASQTFTAGRLATAFAYGVGSAAALYVLMLGGRRLMRRLAQRSQRLQQAMGVVMVVVAVLMLAKLDIKFQTAIANDLPGFLVNPTGELEKAKAVTKQLGDVRGDGGSKPKSAPRTAGGALPKLFEAPALRGNQEWFNTPDDGALTLAELKKQHRVVLIDFWTYTCINCIRTLPQLKAWDKKYRSEGLTIIGVHTPEFPFEKDAGNVRDAIAQNGIKYPVVQDNDYKTWNAYENQYWPAHYLIDADGIVRYTHFGEGEYKTTEKNIRALLEERGTGEDKLGGMTDPNVEEASNGVTTPETYLGAARATGFENGQISEGVHDYGRGSPRLQPNEFAYRGKWGIAKDGAVAGPHASLHVRFRAKKVFLVLGSPDHKRTVRVYLDGKPIRAADAGSDVHGGRATIGSQRLYRLVELDSPGVHLLELRPANGTRGYAFTFG